MAQFTKDDFNVGLWLKLKAQYEERLSMLRRANDEDIDEIRTTRLRGQIAEVKRLLALGEEKPKIKPEQYTE